MNCKRACEMMEARFRSGGSVTTYDPQNEDPVASHDAELDDEKQWRRDTFGDVRLSDEVVEEDDTYIDPELAFLGISGTEYMLE